MKLGNTALSMVQTLPLESSKDPTPSLVRVHQGVLKRSMKNESSRKAIKRYCPR